ncbi:Hypothetical predicted protein [Mytilus galloprovincialis]|uniref:Uncharacterized protein n=3 Tax=Mytilus TaxID=6548 RepID=A0A8B6CSJ7_MYTGA|nr:Hypothetical predicted protein [Mytilus galloprovincialis]
MAVGTKNSKEMKWMNNDYFIKMIWLWTPLFANLTKVNSTRSNNVKYDVMNDQSMDDSIMTLPTQPSNYDHLLKVRLLALTTSSIAIEWNYEETVFRNKTLLGSKVEYFINSGKFSSDMLQPHIHSFTCDHLKVATKYTICISVYLSELVYLKEDDSIVLSKCFGAETIPYIRNDSILVLIILLSYYLFMGMIGVCQWKRKCRMQTSKNRRNEIVHNTENNVNSNSTMRYRELEERQRLTNPVCSIEESRI